MATTQIKLSPNEEKVIEDIIHPFFKDFKEGDGIPYHVSIKYIDSTTTIMEGGTYKVIQSGWYLSIHDNK